MNGVTLGRELRRIRADIPVILVTGFDENIAHTEVEDSGLSAFLKKPLDADLLGRTIWRIFNELDETEAQISAKS